MPIHEFTTGWGAVVKPKVAKFDLKFGIQKTRLAAYDVVSKSVLDRLVLFDMPFTLLDETTKISMFSTKHMVGGQVANVVPVTDTPILTINGRVVQCSSTNIRSDEDRNGYSATVEVPNHLELLNLKRDDVATLQIGGITYTFLVDTLPMNIQSITDSSVSLKLVSPLRVRDSPRAAKISKTWGYKVSAKEVVTELLGTLDWEIVDWIIPEYRLAVENQFPLQVAKKVVAAAGAIITTDPSGKPVVQYKFPVTTNTYNTAQVDFEFNDLEHIVTSREEGVPQDGTNSVLIYDANSKDEGTLDKMEFDVSSLSGGSLFVYPSPVRDVVVGHTAKESLSLTALGGLTTIEKVEQVEVYKGEAIVKYPIAELVEIDFVSVAVTGLSYTEGSTKISTEDTDAYGIINVTYRTTVKQYRVSGVESPAVQFLLQEKD
ncbi:LamG domain-containing protein [Vibrio phage vB_VpS_PG28]|nr:LamG domain-containing protein [Vibrio phage vB_VpS_PG28]